MSLFKDETVSHDTAMTGEISLRGLVLPVGGIKEKVLAAHRAGIRRVMLPARNRKDFEDIPESARNQLDFVWLEHVDDAIDAVVGSRKEPVQALEGPPPTPLGFGLRPTGDDGRPRQNDRR
jgi:ATP-dependent Lon protease